MSEQPSNGRFLNFSLAHLRESRQGVWFALDMVMLLLLVINLSLLLLDSLYRIGFFEALIENALPALRPGFESLNRNFFAIDLVFVAIFLAEFLLRWWVAVRERAYHRWFFYPFIHWYDLLGCIPLGSFRLLRFLRVFSIIYRLHKYRIIDVRQSAIYRFLAFYYDVFMEELSDRVVIKVINGIQEDLADGSDVGQQVIDRLIMPRLSRLEVAVRDLSVHLSADMRDQENHPFSHSLRRSVVTALQGNEDLARLESLPLIGDVLNRHLEELIADVVVDTLAALVNETPVLLKPETYRALAESGNHSWDELDKEVLALVHDILDLVKEQIGQQSWKRKLEKADQSSL